MIDTSFFKSDLRIDNIGSKVSLDPSWTSYDCERKKELLKIPPLLILNFQLPVLDEESKGSLAFLSSFFQSAVEDGPGYSVVFYCRLKQVHSFHTSIYTAYRLQYTEVCSSYYYE